MFIKTSFERIKLNAFIEDTLKDTCTYDNKLTRIC